MFIIFLNWLLIVIQIIILTQRLYFSKKTFLRSPWAYIDMIYIVLNTLITVFVFESKLIDYHRVRHLQSVLSILINLKLVYFMQLIDDIAPLVNIIMKIFYEIRYFMMILGVIIIAFAHAFQQLGKNQLDNINYEKDI